MFRTARVQKKMLETLGLQDDGREKMDALWYWHAPSPRTNRNSCCVKNIEDIRRDIHDLNKKINLLFSKLGLEYQKECREHLPRIIKKGMRRK